MTSPVPVPPVPSEAQIAELHAAAWEFDAVARTVLQIPLGTFDVRATAFDGAARLLQDTAGALRAQVSELRESLRGVAGDAAGEIGARLAGDVTTLVSAFDGDGATLYRLGDALAGAQRAMRDLAVERAEVLGTNPDPAVAQQFTELARGILDGLDRAYRQAGESLPGLPAEIFGANGRPGGDGVGDGQDADAPFGEFTVLAADGTGVDVLTGDVLGADAPGGDALGDGAPVGGAPVGGALRVAALGAGAPGAGAPGVDAPVVNALALDGAGGDGVSAGTIVAPLPGTSPLLLGAAPVAGAVGAGMPVGSSRGLPVTTAGTVLPMSSIRPVTAAWSASDGVQTPGRPGTRDGQILPAADGWLAASADERGVVGRPPADQALSRAQRPEQDGAPLAVGLPLAGVPGQVATSTAGPIGARLRQAPVRSATATSAGARQPDPPAPQLPVPAGRSSQHSLTAVTTPATPAVPAPPVDSPAAQHGSGPMAPMGPMGMGGMGGMGGMPGRTEDSERTRDVNLQEEPGAWDDDLHSGSPAVLGRPRPR